MLPFVENWISKWIVYIWPDKATKPMSAAGVGRAPNSLISITLQPVGKSFS